MHERRAAVKGMLCGQPSCSIPCPGNAGKVVEDVEAHRGQYVGQRDASVPVCLKVCQC